MLQNEIWSQRNKKDNAKGDGEERNRWEIQNVNTNCIWGRKVGNEKEKWRIRQGRDSISETNMIQSRDCACVSSNPSMPPYIKTVLSYLLKNISCSPTDLHRSWPVFLALSPSLPNWNLSLCHFAYSLPALFPETVTSPDPPILHMSSLSSPHLAQPTSLKASWSVQKVTPFSKPQKPRLRCKTGFVTQFSSEYGTF